MCASLVAFVLLMTLTKKIIVHASQDASEALRSACASIRTMTKEIYTTKIGSVVQIGQQTNSFSISLGEELLKSLKMSKVRVHHHQ